MIADAKRWLGYALLGVLVFLVFSIATLPASALSWTLARFGPGTFTLEETQGTVWSGSGVLRLHSPAIAPTIRWQILPSRLLRGAIGLQFEAELERARLATEFRRDLRAWSVHDLTATLPVESVPELVPAARLLAPQGNLQVSGESVRFESGAISGSTNMVWSDAGTQMMGLQGLGQFRIALEGNGKEITIRASTDSGDLEVNADGTWQALGDGTLALQGTATARGRQKELEPLLQMIGPANPDGAHHFTVRTQLPALSH